MNHPNLSSELRLKVFDFLESLVEPSKPGFRIALSSPYVTLQSTAFAIFIYELFGGLEDQPQKRRDDLKEWIKSTQNQSTGLFMDPLAKPDEFLDRDHDWQYFTWQTTFFCLSALDALGAEPDFPFTFIDQYNSPKAINEFLEALDWRDPWLISNKIMFLTSFLIKTGSLNTAHMLFDWLDYNQDPSTGYWGTKQGAQLINAMAGAFHFYFLYFYLQRPVNYIEAIIDHTLSLQQQDGLYYSAGGGDPCLDLDAADILVKFSLITDHRDRDIQASLARTFNAVLRTQTSNGSFCHGLRPTPRKSLKRKLAETIYLDKVLRKPYQPISHSISYSGWEKMQYYSHEGDLWSTWFRSLTLALISDRYKEEYPSGIEWKFRNAPVLGWHNLDRINIIKG